ncbi:MAG: class II fumarate hydratase [Waddliaceae bacterium]
MREEYDSLGSVSVPDDVYWGAQTQRSLQYLSIGKDRMPIELIHAYGSIKKAAALANCDLGLLPKEKMELIVQAAEEIVSGKLDRHFPLYVWMTGSGTQINMNVNEVIANRAIEMVSGKLGSKDPIHPNDHVNMSQSTNDTFPTAMHVSCALQIHRKLLPSLQHLRECIQEKVEEWKDIVKIGRTHLQDAVPLTLGQEFSGYEKMLEDNLKRVRFSLEDLYPLALGGTAVGTGINTHPDFAAAAIAYLAKEWQLPFTTAENPFAIQGAHDALVMLSGVLKTVACSLYKIANDIRLISCGPRCGIHELELPSNEPGSSIMPGKVNPTQCEALMMLAIQVMSHDSATTFGGASGDLEMNVYKPLIIFNLLQAIRLLTDGCRNFADYLIKGTKANEKQIDLYVHHSLMLVTALSPIIGYDQASKAANHAYRHHLSLKDACVELKLLTAEEFDKHVNPREMIHPNIKNVSST